MLQARTYLICATRPEARYQQYTYATLGFAKNASVIKLKPKKATGAASPMELKLMAQIEELKAAMAAGPKEGAGMTDEEKAAAAVKDAEMAAIREQLASALNGQKDANAVRAEQELEAQREEYESRGISLYADSKDTVSYGVGEGAEEREREKERRGGGGSEKAEKSKTRRFGSDSLPLPAPVSDKDEPYFVNLDEDDFRSRRFMYIFSEVGKVTTFGPDGDVKPVSVAIFDNHMTVRRDGEGHKRGKQTSKDLPQTQRSMHPYAHHTTPTADALVLIGGDGMTFVNGEPVKKDVEVPLTPGSRVVIGNDLMLFEWAGKMPEEVMNVDDAISEYHTALNNLMSGGGGGASSAEMDELRAQLEKERKEWEEKHKDMVDKQSTQRQAEDLEAAKRAKEIAMKQVNEMQPAIKAVNGMLKLLSRDFLKIDVSLKAAEDPDTGDQDMTRVNVKLVITNEQSAEK